jgi:hypothetical protein
MRQEFVAHLVGVARDNHAVTVGFARDPEDEDSEDALIVQRATNPKDDVPGLDGVYVEIPIQAYETFGGIVEAVLWLDCFTIRFAASAVPEMGGREGMCARFELADEDFADLREGLEFVFAGCSCFREEKTIAP